MAATPEQISQGQRFARWLRFQRADRGWTQVQLARTSGVSTAYMSLLEKGGILPDGNYQRPSEEIVGKLATALELPLDDVKRAAGHELADIEYVPDIDTILGRMEGFNDFDGSQRELIREAALVAAKNMAETLRKLDSRNVIGRRFTEDEIGEAEAEQKLLAEEGELYVTDEMLTPTEPEPKRKRRGHAPNR